MNISFFIFTLEFPPYAGGAGVYTAGLAKGLSFLGHKVMVLAPSYGEEDKEFDSKQPYVIIRMNLSKRNFVQTAIQAILNFLKVLIFMKPHRILITDYGAQKCASLATFIFPFPIPYYITVHGSEILWHFKHKNKLKQKILALIVARFFMKARAIFCVSKFTRKKLLKVMPQLCNKTYVVHPGIDLERLPTPNKEEILKLKTSLKISGPVLLTVARLIPEKGIDMVLHALSQLVSEFPELKYIVIGTGPDFNRLQRIVRNVHDKELNITH